MSLVNGLVISSFMSLGFDITPHLFRKTFDTVFYHAILRDYLQKINYTKHAVSYALSVVIRTSLSMF